MDYLAIKVLAENLGSQEFRKDHNVKLAYSAGAMYHGIASKELVIAMAKANLLSFFGAGGLSFPEIEKNIITIQRALKNREPFGVNFLHQFENISKEIELVNLLFKYKINKIEASAFMKVTKALVYYRVKGLRKKNDGKIYIGNLIMAKLSRIEVAEAFMSPAPNHILEELLNEELISAEQCFWAKNIPMCDDICIEGDSGGHTDGGNIMILFPAIMDSKKRIEKQYNYHKKIRIGLAGGIGTPHAAANAFFLGADFILTGSINQCTLEANTTAQVKEMLQNMGIHDTAYAPAGDMFEIGAKVQVLKKGTLFSARANRLYTLYSCYNSINEIPEKTIKSIEKSIFRKSISDVYDDIKAYYEKTKTSAEIIALQENEKIKMAAIFKWYFIKSNPLNDVFANQKPNYQIHVSPALGAFNNWVQGTSLESWKERHVADIAKKIMQEAAVLYTNNLKTQ